MSVRVTVTVFELEDAVELGLMINYPFLYFVKELAVPRLTDVE